MMLGLGMTWLGREQKFSICPAGWLVNCPIIRFTRVDEDDDEETL